MKRHNQNKFTTPRKSTSLNTGNYTFHTLKTWPEYFQAIKSGKKKFEVRNDDRDFREGDVLILKEYDPVTKKYTGEEDYKSVGYILKGGQFGIKKGFVIMSLV